MKYIKLNGKYKEYKEEKIRFKEYADILYQTKGYKNYADYRLQTNHRLGLSKSMYKNKASSAYLGIVIAERVLSKVFKDVKRMPINNPGYDFVCRYGHKIDVKSSCLRYINCSCNKNWMFSIRKNKIADYFLLLAFDNRKDLNPKHIWLIKGSEVVRSTLQNTRLLNDKMTLSITNTKRNRRKYKQYRQTDKLKETIKCCNTFGDLMSVKEVKEK